MTAGNAHAARLELLGDNDTDGLVPGPVAADRNYTEGSRISITDISPHWARWAADRVPGFGLTDRDGSERVRYFGVSIGQDIYTPDAISKRTRILNDEPYAGWLYASAFMTVEDRRWQRTLELQVGTTGPMSQAGEVQTWWHRQQGIRLPRGWQYQLRNEPGLMARGEMRWRVGSGRHADFIPHAGAALGNVKTEAWAGATVRLGLPLPGDFGPSKLTPARSGGAHLYLFARAEGRAVAHNLFLDGNTFSTGPHVTRIPLVAETQMGAGMGWRRLGLRYMFSYTTAEFRERPTPHEYGSVGISF